VTVELSGTFLFKARPMAPGPGTPMPDTLVLGAIVNTGKAQVFLKGWGPKATMEKHRAAFDAMLASIKSGG
jgi:hypothetical protein